MRLNRAVEYGIAGMMVLARAGRERSTMLREVSMATSISETFLSKIFQKLVRNGLIRSRRGFRGGFHLARPASQITLREVIEALQGPISFPSPGKHRHSNQPSDTSGRSLLRQVLESAQARVRAVFEETTVADLATSGFPTSREKLV
ncbi:MAG TPA: Rrf2 family transcriptional regulator [Candidatus Polarisedimenticolia bacterium]|nr:Rrf2 family transcriptional regulator [Candidatus Polarisedimenticolia bacterium]